MQPLQRYQRQSVIQRHSFCSLNRRGALIGLFGFVTSRVLATGASPMEGTWGGADAQGRTAQITIVGNRVIGFFWGQDYHDAENVRFSNNGTQLDFTIDGAKATFVRDPAHRRITVHQTDRGVTSIDLKKD
jgi:hypothetical protein